MIIYNNPKPNKSIIKMIIKNSKSSKSKIKMIYNPIHPNHNIIIHNSHTQIYKKEKAEKVNNNQNNSIE